MIVTPSAAPRSPRKAAIALPRPPPPMITMCRPRSTATLSRRTAVLRTAAFENAKAPSVGHGRGPAIECWSGYLGGAALWSGRAAALSRGLVVMLFRGRWDLVAHIHQAAQLVSAARQPRADCANGYAEDLGNLLVAHALKADEEDHLALLLRQPRDGGLQIAQLQDGDGIGLHGQHRRHFFDSDVDALAHRAPDIVDVLIVQDREQPGAQIGAGLPQMLFGDRASQAALDEIVRACHVPGQRPRIAAQPRNFRFEQPSVVGHFVALIPCSRAPLFGRYG